MKLDMTLQTQNLREVAAVARTVEDDCVTNQQEAPIGKPD